MTQPVERRRFESSSSPSANLALQIGFSARTRASSGIGPFGPDEVCSVKVAAGPRNQLDMLRPRLHRDRGLFALRALLAERQNAGQVALQVDPEQAVLGRQQHPIHQASGSARMSIGIEC